jgi:site-specific DNA-methyltransferase (adenine-specific)
MMAKASKITDQVISLSDLSQDPANVRRHPERNREAILSSLRRFGPARSIVVDCNGVVRAGNGTLEAARALGIESVRVIDAKPDELIAVRRSDWTASESTAYGIADNRTAELADWDETALAAQLRSLQSEDFDLADVGYSEGEVDALIEGLGTELAGSDEQSGSIDSVPEKFEVVVECRDESHQREIYERFHGEGLSCRVLTL